MHQALYVHEVLLNTGPLHMLMILCLLYYIKYLKDIGYISTKSDPWFQYAFNTKQTEVQRETRIYPFLSLFNELNGALGLFLGFSLLGFIEDILKLILIIKSKF